MSDRFTAQRADKDAVAKLSALVPCNPFMTTGYVEARMRTGARAWTLAGVDEPGCCCGAFVWTKGVGRKLEIASLPLVTADSAFWGALESLCRRERVLKVELNTFGSPAGVVIPEVFDCVRRQRHEWILDLEGDVDDRIDRRHKQHLKKAGRAGFTIRRTRSVEAIGAHRDVIDSSMDRRRRRGEDAPTAGPSLEFAALLQTGAGELFQALDGDEVVASGLILRAPWGAYFHSRGASPEGMNKARPTSSSTESCSNSRRRAPPRSTSAAPRRGRASNDSRRSSEPRR